MAITDLRTLGISDSDISYVYSSEGKTVTEDGGGTKAGSGAAAGATTGVVLGAIAGLVVANGILPGLGTLFVAGPLAGALGLTGAVATTTAGAVTGLAAGGFLGALMGLGVKEDEAKVYEERVKLGDILVTARTSQSAAAHEIFRKHDADEIREY
ncbi:MAG: low temperature-induced protein [Parcubacteria group bacterium]|nr:low temperature-induced protein [Parcubacteria group bacterium]